MLAKTVLGEGLPTAEEIYSQADAAFAEGNYVEAERLYKQGLNADDKNPVAYNNLGIIYSLSDERLKESILNFVQAANINPNYADPFANLGLVCYRTGQYERAKAYLERAIKLDPGNAKYYFTMAWIFLRGNKDYDSARACLKKAVEVDPDYAEAFYLLGMLYLDSGNRLEVFDIVTNLRMLNKEELASSLENLVRQPSEPVQGQQTTSKFDAISMDYGVATSVPVSVPVKTGVNTVSQASVNSGGNMNGSGTIQFKIQFQQKEKKETKTKQGAEG